MSRLSRLRSMSCDEVLWRAAQVARIHRDRWRASLSPPRWDRSALLDILAPEVVDPALRTQVGRHDWEAAHRSVARALRARPRAFVLDPSNDFELRGRILDRWPEARLDAARRADRIMGGRYDLLGYRGLSFSDSHGRLDWHLDPVYRRRSPLAFWADVPYLNSRRVGDHKIIWELNRHQHWLVLGRALWLTRDRRYGWAIVAQLESWLEANPPLTGINWGSALELGLRALSWVWSLHLLLADTDEGAAGPQYTPWLLDVLLGVDRQLRHVENNLSYYFSPNTHLTGEALALYVAGVALPELEASGRWAATGRRILLDEIDRQINADGGHVERSTHYHRYTLDFYLLALLTAERSGDLEAIARFTDAVTRLATFALAVADDRGRMPLIGDDDGGMLWPIAGRACNDVRDSLALAAVVLGRPDLARWGVPEEVFWIAGHTALEQEPFVLGHSRKAHAPASATFAESGYVIARDTAGGQLVFDVGPHGYLNGGHAHADALSVTLAVEAGPLLVDPGTYTYTTNPILRDRLRSSANHNTLTLDRKPASVPAGPFHWTFRADARLHAARHNPAFDYAEGAHDGYGEHRHVRIVLRSPAGGWLLVDEVLGRGHHTADLHWHFDPAWTVSADNVNRLRAEHLAGDLVWLIHDAAECALFHGDDETGLGWFAPAYGTLLPTWSARATSRNLTPISIATWVAAGAAPPSLMRVSTECDPGGGSAVGVRVLQRGVAWTTLLRPGEARSRETRGCAAGAFHTDARMLHYGSRGDRLISLSACDAGHLLALREGWLSIAADEPVADLYVECGRDTIDLWSSAPAVRLRLQGALVGAASSIRINGRELPACARERADSAIVLPSHFGEPRRITPCAALQDSRT